MKHLILTGLLFFFNIRNRSWYSLPKYWGSIRFVIIVNAFYYIIYKKHPLWDFRSNTFAPELLRGLHVFVATPLLILLYLSRVPRKITDHFFHLISWTGVSMLTEWIVSRQSNMIIYKYGWNTLWSGLVFFQMYWYSFIYSKRPFFAWLLTVSSIVNILDQFRIPKT